MESSSRSLLKAAKSNLVPKGLSARPQFGFSATGSSRTCDYHEAVTLYEEELRGSKISEHGISTDSQLVVLNYGFEFNGEQSITEMLQALAPGLD